MKEAITAALIWIVVIGVCAWILSGCAPGNQVLITEPFNGVMILTAHPQEDLLDDYGPYKLEKTCKGNPNPDYCWGHWNKQGGLDSRNRD